MMRIICFLYRLKCKVKQAYVWPEIHVSKLMCPGLRTNPDTDHKNENQAVRISLFVTQYIRQWIHRWQKAHPGTI